MQTNLRNIHQYAPAGHGTKHWIQQRLTALINLTFIPTLMICIAYSQNIVIALQNPFIAVIALITTCSIAKHMMLGMQIIIEDYVHTTRNKITLLIANIIFVTITAGITLFSILKIALG